MACRNDNLDIVRLLLANGADINKADYDGRTPLYLACRNDNLDIVRLLLANGADINKADYDGRTPLLWACRYNKPEIVELLLNKGAQESINKADNCGETPLYWACYHDNLDIITLLLAIGAEKSVNIADKYGRTPLYEACDNNNLELVKLLLASGADVDQRSLNQARGKQEILELLNLVKDYDAAENKIAFIAYVKLNNYKMLIKRALNYKMSVKRPLNYKMLVKRALVQSLNEVRKETFKSIESTVFGKLYDQARNNTKFVDAFGINKQNNIYEFIRRAAEKNHIYLEKDFIDKSIMASKSNATLKKGKFTDATIRFTE